MESSKANASSIPGMASADAALWRRLRPAVFEAVLYPPPCAVEAAGSVFSHVDRPEVGSFPD